MSYNDEIRNGIVIEAIDQNTGEVKMFEKTDEKPFTGHEVILLLIHMGWTEGDTLFFQCKNGLAEIYNKDMFPLGTISANLAKSFRGKRFAKFIQ